VTSEPEQFISAGTASWSSSMPEFGQRPGQGPVTNGKMCRLADVYTFRDGKAIQMRAFADLDEALRWAECRVAAPTS